jgi:hypothetical protein
MMLKKKNTSFSRGIWFHIIVRVDVFSFNVWLLTCRETEVHLRSVSQRFQTIHHRRLHCWRTTNKNEIVWVWRRQISSNYLFINESDFKRSRRIESLRRLTSITKRVSTRVRMRDWVFEWLNVRGRDCVSENEWMNESEKRGKKKRDIKVNKQIM